jgi:hypothetical protein
VDAVSRHRARPVHDGRLDGQLQRHRVRARAAPRPRHPARRDVRVHAGASLGREVGAARGHHAGSHPPVGWTRCFRCAWTSWPARLRAIVPAADAVPHGLVGGHDQHRAVTSLDAWRISASAGPLASRRRRLRRLSWWRISDAAPQPAARRLARWIRTGPVLAVRPAPYSCEMARPRAAAAVQYAAHRPTRTVLPEPAGPTSRADSRGYGCGWR